MKKSINQKILMIVVIATIITRITTSFAYNIKVKQVDGLNKKGSGKIAPVTTLSPKNNVIDRNPIQSSNTQEPQIMTLAEILKAKGIKDPAAKLRILVDKSDHALRVFWGSEFLKEYHVDIGLGGQGDKQIEGDYKTPEGTFYITEKTVLSPADQYLGTRWMRLSYPNIEAADRGLKQGLISQATHEKIVYAINNKLTPPQDTPLGSAVGIHGGTVPSFGKDWTWGCVGLKSQDVQEFYDFTKVGTPVIIQK